VSHSRTAARSPYMEFAKLHSAARYNLAASGLASYPLSELPVKLCDLEINGPTAYGYAPLQERIARKNNVAPECVIAAAGTSMANHLAMAGLIEPGDEVLIEHPTYQLLVSTAKYLGAVVRSFPRHLENGFQVDPDEVARCLSSRTRLIILTNLHNPSGALTDNETLHAVGNIAAGVGARVLVDEVYLETLFENRPPSAFHLGNQFVVTNSLTKAYGLSGLRCGWILAEPELAERIWRLNDLFAATPVHVGELLSVIAFDNLEKVATRAKSLLETNRANLDLLLRGRSDQLEFFRPQYGTVIFPKLRAGNTDIFCTLLKSKYETSVAPGRFFDAPEHFRIGIGGEIEMTTIGLQRLGEALDSVIGRLPWSFFTPAGK
jgi:aspartate/methionine/tyrosine aminotransferase